ncbi:MAG: CcmD family protein [bacterium]
MKGLGSVFVAYLVIWVLMIIYLFRLDAKTKALARELEDLKRDLAEARGRGER